MCAEPNCGFLLAGAPIDHCRVATLLNRGALADLYLATALDAPASSPRMLVKVLRTPVAAPVPHLEQGLEQLLALRHPHVHAVQGVGWTGQGGTVYLLSRYEEQGSLLATVSAPSRLPPLAVSSIVRQIAEGLHYAHERQLVHGRLKPENCLLVGPATVQVSDFYRLLLPAELRTPAPTYMAPEQAVAQADPATDQYALAILTYQLLSQPPAFGGVEAAELAAQQAQSGGALRAGLRPDVPAPVEMTLRRALNKQPRERFPTVLTFATALQAALEGSGPLDPAAVRASTSFPGTSQPLVERSPAAVPRALAPVCLLPGHTANLTALRWSPQGQLLASADERQSVRVWRVHRRIGVPVATLTGPTSPVLALKWSPDGRLLAGTASDGTVYLWSGTGDAVAPEAQRGWWAHDGHVTDVDWSPTNRYLATAGSDRTVRVWDTTGTARAAWQAHGRGGVTALAWSSDGRYLVSGGADRQIMLWDADSGAQLAAFDGPGDEIRHLAWSPSSALLASVSKRDPHLYLWNPQTGEQLATLSGHGGEVVGLLWASDGAWLASASTDRTLRVWNTQRPASGIIGQPLQLGGQPFAMAGDAGTGLLAVGLADMQIQVLQLST
jgi:hypothetical protein